MEGYKGSEQGENYLIQGPEANPHLATIPSLEQVEVMDNEGPPEFIVDQGLYYPATTNYYGYYCTGFEPTGEWDEHQRFLGLAGQDLHYAGLQTESLPYVYYTPTYGYGQSPYNPYNPYIPGAIVGVDGPFVGMQQYYTGSTYQHPSQTYLPLVVQPTIDSIPNGGMESHLSSAGPSSGNGPTGPGSKLKTSSSAGSVKASSYSALADGRAETTALNNSHHSGKRSEVSKANAASSKHPVASTSATIRTVSHSATSQIPQVHSLGDPLKVATTVTNGFNDIGVANGRGWAVVDKFRPRFQYGGVLNNRSGNPDFLGEQNRGPRTNRSKSQWMPSFPVESYTPKEGANSTPGKIVISGDDYNKEDFPANYPDAKFFVIKSYSEDDVHKSIKYNVWSSTPNGNKRLDSAFEEARKIAAVKQSDCPVFLFFSVNASGQFCGVAEMTGPVDFNRDMEFWQQNKWSGSFPVKWRIIKDVQNNNFRRIILENNENKPVTNSRDTQEIQFKQGMEMLNIFKSHSYKTSILDDFMYYEERQKIMQEEKARLLGKSYDTSFFIPAIVLSNKPKVLVDLPPNAEGKTTSYNHPSNIGKVVSNDKQVLAKADGPVSSSSGVVNTKPVVVGDVNIAASALKIGSLTIDPKQAEATEPRPLATAAAASTSRSGSTDVVTVGSMPVKVNGFSESSSILTVGTIPIVPKAATPIPDNSVTGTASPKSGT
ncbi:hypothetical protein Sjap_007219 [Stephania japonica]|uniref:YTH domain-containing family protein n=1 Tax=Stephania japonica TaxID=461633 RepID=A0AAP0JN10_9MAGN